MPVWGLCGGPSLQEQQWGAGACTLLLASPRACSSLTGRRFTVLWATYGFSRNPCHSSYGPHASPRLGTNTVVLVPVCPCQPGQDPWSGWAVTEWHRALSHNRAVISASCGLCPARQPGRGSTPKCPCVFLLPAASKYLSSGTAHESPGKAGGVGGSLSSEPCSLCGPSPHTPTCLPRRPGSQRDPVVQ